MMDAGKYNIANSVSNRQVSTMAEKTKEESFENISHAAAYHT